MYSRIVKKCKIGNRKFGFWILASALTREPPSRWCSGETPPQGGQLGRGPDETYEIACDGRQRSTRPPGGNGRRRSTRPPEASLLTRKDTAFPSVLLLQEIYIFEQRLTVTVDNGRRDRQEVVF